MPFRYIVISWQRRIDGGEKTQNSVFSTWPRNNEMTQICAFSLFRGEVEKRKFASFRYFVAKSKRFSLFRGGVKKTKRRNFASFRYVGAKSKRNKFASFRYFVAKSKRRKDAILRLFAFVFLSSPRNNEKTKWHKSATIVNVSRSHFISSFPIMWRIQSEVTLFNALSFLIPSNKNESIFVGDENKSLLLSMYFEMAIEGTY